VTLGCAPRDGFTKDTSVKNPFSERSGLNLPPVPIRSPRSSRSAIGSSSVPIVISAWVCFMLKSTHLIEVHDSVPSAIDVVVSEAGSVTTQIDERFDIRWDEPAK
jgi:hypothetical protein